MSIENIQGRLERLESDPQLQNFIAQANSRYILYNTAEQRDKFPPYNISDENLNVLALQYLSLGAELAENQQLSAAIAPLEKGAHLLETVHGSPNNRLETSTYYSLIAGLAYYVSFQYSKCFILVKKLEGTTVIASMTRSFLSRDFTRLSSLVYGIITSADYTDEVVATLEEIEGRKKIYEFVIAKSLGGYMNFLRSGDQRTLEIAKEQLRTLLEISSLENDPDIWWVVRLLLLISQGFDEASVWNVLANYFDLADSNVAGYIRGLVYQSDKAVYELFITQRNSLTKVLNADDLGCIVSIPTSSGKTRIAEIAILNSIFKKPECKVLYIAPFKALAFEIETSMARVFSDTGIIVSHLYGGNGYSSMDAFAIDEASVIIATPEKAKAIIRSNADFMASVNLVIIDEGHLLGDNDRLIPNEIFYEELRYYIKGQQGRFLILSAVLPNPEDLANWLTENEHCIYKENWRPSDERLGILEYHKLNVNLHWESLDAERPSSNTDFIKGVPLPKKPKEKTVKFHPGNKNEAVAATAYKLRTFGPVLIFVGQKPSVFTMAKAYLKALGNQSADHVWKDQSDWRSLELACAETYGERSDWLSFAKKGILCHNANLHVDVRLPMERLMRNDKPLVIISTSTLGQGVNLGISTVIFSTLYQSGIPLSGRDFWNIAGRAGRAFVDHEGKILVAEDTSNLAAWARTFKFKNIRKYFDKKTIDIAQSGLLAVIKKVKELAAENDVDFSYLLELIAENRLEEQENGLEVEDKFNLIDDTLLALQLAHSTADAIDFSWVDEFFGRSLAAIQASTDAKVKPQDVVNTIKARINGITLRVGDDLEKWSSVVSSGVPLNSDLIIEDRLDDIIDAISPYLEKFSNTENYLSLLAEMESFIRDLPVISAKGDSLTNPNIQEIREHWLNAVPLSRIHQLPRGEETVGEIYTFVLPWVLNGIAKKLRGRDHESEAIWLEELAVLVEFGLPDLMSVKVYQAGIRSRVAAKELAALLSELEFDESISAVRSELFSDMEYYAELVSPTTKEWLELLVKRSERKTIYINRVDNFTFDAVPLGIDTLFSKRINGQQYLISPDLNFCFPDNGKMNFNPSNDIVGVSFKYNPDEKVWKMHNDNPYVIVRN